MSKVAVSVVMTVLILGILLYLLATQVNPSVKTKADRINNTIQSTTVDVSNGSVTAPAP